MKSLIIKLTTVFIIVVFLFPFTAKDIGAAISTVSGYVLVEGTNAPVVGVWVVMQRGDGLRRYEKTNSDGWFGFEGWPDMTPEEQTARLDVQIDTNLDGTADSIWFPSDPSGNRAHFDCSQDPFTFLVVKPQGWGGSFDQYGGSSSPCVFCMNNGTPGETIPNLYYKQPSGNLTLTPTPPSTPTPTPSVTIPATPTPTPPTCTMVFTGAASMEVGTQHNYRATVGGLAVDEVRFVVGDPAIASVITPDTTSPYDTVLTALAPGNSSITANAIYNGLVACSRPINFVVSPAQRWWQVKEGVVSALQNIVSKIPSGCAFSASCSPYLIRNELPNSPAVALYRGTLNLNGASVSDSAYNWSVRSPNLTTRLIKYQDFISKAIVAPINNIGGAFNGNSLENSGTVYNGYTVFSYDGTLNGPQFTLTTPDISDHISIGDRRVILFVKNATVKIERQIELNNGTGLFVLISTGNIEIDPSVGGPQETPSALPDLEGIYVTEGKFSTQTYGPGLDNQLHVRGMVIANEVEFERDLADNSVTPGELIEYAPDQILLFPNFMVPRNIEWTEVSP